MPTPSRPIGAAQRVEGYENRVTAPSSQCCRSPLRKKKTRRCCSDSTQQYEMPDANTTAERHLNSKGALDRAALLTPSKRLRGRTPSRGQLADPSTYPSSASSCSASTLTTDLAIPVRVLSVFFSS